VQLPCLDSELSTVGEGDDQVLLARLEGSSQAASRPKGGGVEKNWSLCARLA